MEEEIGGPAGAAAAKRDPVVIDDRAPTPPAYSAGEGQCGRRVEQIFGYLTRMPATAGIDFSEAAPVTVAWYFPMISVVAGNLVEIVDAHLADPPTE